jgi:AcrR family transcriptional regulator
MGAAPAPVRRVDAERNRARIIAVARKAFAEPGAEPSMAEIARRAGVGMATLYRNFPSRLDLVEELYRKQIDDICAAAASAAGQTPGEAFFAWLDQFQVAGARKGALASLLRPDSGGGASLLSESRSRVIAAGQPLLAAAQRSGEVRDDVALGPVLDAVVALERLEGAPAARVTMVQVLFDGLRSRPA